MTPFSDPWSHTAIELVEVRDVEEKEGKYKAWIYWTI